MENQEQPFVKKSIEQPVMGVDLKSQISQIAPNNSYDAGFYQTNKFYIWAISLGVLVIVLLSYFAFRKPNVPVAKEANVDIEISAPQTVPSGGEAGYTLKLHNNDQSKLTQVRLELVYPDGFIYENSVPKADNLSGTLFSVPDLVSGQISPGIFIKAKATGNVGDQKQLIAKMYYHYSNFNSEFLKEKAFSFALGASNVDLKIAGPETASNAQLVEYVIKYKNNSDQQIQNARVKTNFSGDFTMAQSTPAVSLGNNIWELDALNPGAEGEIHVQGNFKTANSGESKPMAVEFSVAGNSGDYNVQATDQITTAISSLPLFVTQEASASQTQTPGVVNPGETLTFNINYQNNSSVAANGVNIVVTLNSKAVDLSTIQAEGGQVNSNNIIWSAAGVPNLEILNPSEKGTLHFSVNVKNPAVKDSSTNLTVISDIKIKSNEYQTFFPGNSLTIKVASPSSLTSSLNFVSGALPPKVGQATTYKVRLSLTNSTNDYSNGLLTAFLPLGLVSFDQQSITPSETGKVQYDPATGKLTWSVGVLPANSGRFTTAKILEFNIRINPSQSLSGQSPVLVKTLNFTAKDNFTGQNINLTADSLTTQSLQGQGYSNGTVEQ